MSTNWKSIRLRLEMRTLMVFLAILSFDSCFSLGNEEGVTRDLRPDDRYALDLRGVSFHRKLLGRFRNPYTHLNKDRPPVAALAPASSSVPSHRGTTTRESSALHPPRRSPTALHVSSAPPPSVPLSKNPSVRRSSSSSMVPVVAGCVGGAVFLLLLATGLFFFKSKAGKSVNPWSTGLSGQLQKVFITGVPKLKRSEIEAACEDFSNVIGSCPIGTLFKGTLSTGVEIAVLLCVSPDYLQILKLCIESLMYQSNEDDDDFFAALCFDQSNGGEDPYAFIQTEQGNLFQDFGSSSGVNLQPEQEQVCNNNIGDQFGSFSGNLPQVCSFTGENNGLAAFGGHSIGFGSSQLDLGTSSYSGLLQQEPHQVCSFRGRNNDSVPRVETQREQVCCGVVEINSSSSVGGVKEELEEECSRKRGRTGPGTKASREKKRREMLNDKFMDLSSFLEPTRTPKTDKPAIIDDAIRVVNQLRGEAHELKETNQKLLEEIKSLKAEKNELREEKLVLKADKEKMEQQLKSMTTVPSPGFLPSHPAAFHQNKMAVYASYGYYPNMPMMPYLLPPSQRDTSQDQQNCSFAA